jgi:hypothetical protein
MKQETCKTVCHLLHAKFFFGLLVDPEDGDDTLVRSVGGPMPNYTALKSRRSKVFTVIVMGTPNAAK